MFCFYTDSEGQSRPCFVVWYKDPIHLQEERRPPSVRALDELRNLGHGVQALEMMLVSREVNRYKLDFGVLQHEASQFFFDKENGERYCLSFSESFVPHNKTLISLDEQMHIKVPIYRVPLLSSTDITFETIGGVHNLSDAWIGALVVSRVKVTVFMIWNILNNAPFIHNPFTLEFEENLHRARESGNTSANFLVFIPTAKPKSLQEFLDKASGTGVDDEKVMEMLETSLPLFEGYCKVHIGQIRKDKEEPFHHVNVRFDDYGGTKKNEKWMGRVDFGREDETLQGIGVPKEAERGYLSLDMPTLINSVHCETSSVGHGDWGFTGCIENTEVFMIPHSIKNEDVFEQNRSRNVLKTSKYRSNPRTRDVYKGLMMSSVDNKYKLVNNIPNFDDIIHDLMRGEVSAVAGKRERDRNPTQCDDEARNYEERPSKRPRTSLVATEQENSDFDELARKPPPIPQFQLLHEHDITEGIRDVQNPNPVDVSIPNNSEAAERDQAEPLNQVQEEVLSIPPSPDTSPLNAATPSAPPENQSQRRNGANAQIGTHSLPHSPLSPGAMQYQNISQGPENQSLPQNEFNAQTGTRSLTHSPLSPGAMQYQNISQGPENQSLPQNESNAQTGTRSLTHSPLSPGAMQNQNISQGPHLSPSLENLPSLKNDTDAQERTPSPRETDSHPILSREGRTLSAAVMENPPSSKNNVDSGSNQNHGQGNEVDKNAEEKSDESLSTIPSGDLSVTEVPETQFRTILDSFTRPGSCRGGSSLSGELLKKSDELYASSKRRIMRSDEIPARVEGTDILSIYEDVAFLGEWCRRNEFRESARNKVQWWLRDRIELTRNPRFDVTPVAFNSWGDYRRYCIFMAIYLIYVELYDISSLEKTWAFDTQNAPMGVSPNSLSSAMVKHFYTDQSGCDTLIIERTGRRQSSGLHCRLYDVVCVDFLVPRDYTVERKRSGFGYVFQQTVTPIKPYKVEEFCESQIVIMGWSRGSPQGPQQQINGEFVSVRKVGYIGSSIRAFEAALRLENLPSEVRGLLMGHDAIRDTRRIGEHVRKAGELGRLEYNVALLQSLWFLRDGPADYISRITVFPDEPLSLENNEFGCLNTGQGAAIAEVVSALPFKERSSIFTRTTCVVGPAGTGKTNTLVHCISAIANLLKIRHRLLYGENIRRSLQGPRGARTGILKEAFLPLKQEAGILCICPTNSAVDVIEEKLQSGIAVSLEEGGLKRVYPLYERVTPSLYDEDRVMSSKRSKDLHGNFKRLFSGLGYENKSGWITLTTFGSLHRLFERKKHNPRFSAVFIDEASQVGRLDLNMMFDTLPGPNYDIPQNFILAFFGDPLQQGTVVKGDRTPFSTLYTVSLLETMVPRMAGYYIDGEDQVSNVMLGVQYRMNPCISALSNKVARREVQSAPCTIDRAVIRTRGSQTLFYPELTASEDSPIDRSLLAHPVVFFDPYHQHGLSFQEHYSRETSNREAIVVSRIIKTLSAEPGFRDEDVFVLSVYGRQLASLKRVVGEQLQRYRGDLSVSNKIRFSTIAGVQGGEAKVVIFSATRSRKNLLQGVRRDDSIGLVGDVKGIYVMLTRASCHLYIVGDSEILSACSREWNSIINFIAA